MLNAPEFSPRKNLLRQAQKRLLWALCVCAVFALGAAVHADELRLKDGSKVNGKIVGYENDSFKVETSYGFALVRRDQVLSIDVASTAAAIPVTSSASPATTGATAASSTRAVLPIQQGKFPTPAVAKPRASKHAGVMPPPRASLQTLSGEQAPAALPSPAAASAAPPTPTAKLPARTETTSVIPNGDSLAASPPDQRPPAPALAAPALPEAMREQVSGNAYINDTFGFRMYKPPDWQVIEGARKIMPGAIVAMGTEDQTTYVLIGQQPFAGALDTQITPAEKRLQEILENYRPLGERHMVISGCQAIERRFRGTLDDHDWSGIVALIARGHELYTLFGMTYADSDLVQIQENVISRTIASLEFRK